MRRAQYLDTFNSIMIDFKSTKVKCKYTVMYICHFCIISTKYLLKVSLGFHDMSILVTVRVSVWKKICSDSGLNAIRVKCSKIDITLNFDFDRISKIDNILKTREYFYTKFGQYMAKSHMYYM